MTEFAFHDPAWGNNIHDGLTIVKAEGSTVGEVATSLASMENVYEYNAFPYKLIYKHDDSPEWKEVDFADLLGYESIKWVNGEAIGCGSDVPTDRSADGKEFFIASDTLDFYNIVVRYLTR